MKPKATIVYLTRSTESDIRDLKKSLKLLDLHYNDQFHYPVLIFHEDLSNGLKAELQNATRSALTFAELHFELPAFLKKSEVPEKILGRFNVGYRHMCRFFAGLIFEHPALAGFDWYWRLDTDSFLRGNVAYDVFQFMEAGDLWYGYIVMLEEKPEVVNGLWSAAKNYMKDAKLVPLAMEQLTSVAGAWNYLYYYNNFEICKLEFGRSRAYQEFFRYLDHLGGIYKFRWGDAPIRTIAVSMLVPKAKVHRFTDIPYSHAGYCTHWRHCALDRLESILNRHLIRKAQRIIHFMSM